MDGKWLLVLAVAGLSAYIITMGRLRLCPMCKGLTNLVGLGVKLKTGFAAPTWSARTIGGETLDSASVKGAPVVYVFRATWCSPCVKELPDLAEFHERFAGRGVKFVGVLIRGERADVARDLALKHRVTFPNVLDDGRISSSFGRVSSVPTLVFVDRNGTVVEIAEGRKERAELEKMIERIADA